MEVIIHLLALEKRLAFALSGRNLAWSSTLNIVTRYTAAIKKYIQEQLKEDLEYDQMTIVEYIDPFTGEPVKKHK